MGQIVNHYSKWIRFKTYPSTNLVALPTHTINKPVAIGSRVPACPTCNPKYINKWLEQLLHEKVRLHADAIAKRHLFNFDQASQFSTNCKWSPPCLAIWYCYILIYGKWPKIVMILLVTSKKMVTRKEIWEFGWIVLLILNQENKG